MTLTATPDRVREADASEVIMLAYWRTCLESGTPARVVEGLITAAVDYEPLLGQPMAECQRPGCGLWVAEDARDQYGRLYCPDGCADDVASADQEAHDARAVEPIVRPLHLGPPRDFILRRF